MDVLALVGASGTGKSHRASVIAAEYGVELIIDDGLLIRDTKILGGKSAKREQTRVAAVRRAMFQDPAQAAEVVARISEINPMKVLVLGTSRAMVHRIVDALSLPQPIRYINIEDVASADEIRRAMRVRREQGKHVIPAPTFEVKRTFSGYLVDPLRLRLFGRDRAAKVGAVDVEKSVVRPTFSSLGRFSMSDTVIIAIVRHTARDIDGVARVGRVGLDGVDEGVVLRLELVLAYGYFLPRVLQEVQLAAKQAVEHMTALNVLSVTVWAHRLHIEPVKSSQGG